MAAGFAAIGVSVAALVGIAIPDAAHSAPTIESALPDTQYAADVASAAEVAAAYGHPVAIDPQTTSVTSVSVMPDGGFQYEADSLPVRVKQEGGWAAVDESLTAQGGGLLGPKVSAAPVRFSAGGSNVLDEVQTSSGDWITETWPYGNLPAPTVSGPTATYAEVLPGVDLTLTATSTGMTNVLVVKNAAAAADPRLQSIRLPISGASVAAAPLDTMSAKATDGSTIIAGSPLWWDSSNGATAAGPGGDDPARPVSHRTDASGLTLNVAKSIAGSSPAYPVFIDPEWTWNSADSHVWYTDAAYPSQTYYDANVGTDLRVGISAPYKSDMFFQFPLPSLPGAIVSNAVVNTTQNWSGTCSPSAIDVHIYGPKAAGFNWTTEQSYGSAPWQGVLQSQNPNYGCSGVAAHAVGWTVTSGIAAQMAAAATSVQLAWTYHDPSSDVSRRHYSTSASLVITYDRPPATPTAPTVLSPSRSCGTAASPAMINGAQPIVFSAALADPDTDQNWAKFYVIYATDTAQSSPTIVASASSPYVSTPGHASATLPSGALTDGVRYAWRARASDGSQLSGYSAYCYITIDNDAPASPPAVTTATTVFVLGGDVTVTLGAGGAAGVVGFEYWIADNPNTSIPVAAPVTSAKLAAALPSCGSADQGARFACLSGASATVHVAPIDAKSVLWAASYDAAGNVSTSTPLALFGAGGISATYPGPPTSFIHQWLIFQSASSLDTVIPDINQSGNPTPDGEHDLTIGGTLSPIEVATLPSGADGAVLSFSGGAPSTGIVSTATSAVNTIKPFTASAWVSTNTLTGTHVILAQSGSSRSGFVLEEVAGVLQFCVQPQLLTAPVVCVKAPSLMTANTWQMVTGMWDPVNGQLRLYLGQELMNVFPYAVPAGDTTAGGAVTVGSGQVAGAAANQWQGQITNPLVAQGFVTTEDLGKSLD